MDKTPDRSPGNTELLDKELGLVRERIASLGKLISETQAKLIMARKEERLVAELLGLRGAKPAHQLPTAVSGALQEAIDQKPEVVRAVLEELRVAGRPLHISDLMRILNERKIRIPGTGNQANLISYLRREPEVVRTSRGMYGLESWGVAEQPPLLRQKRIRRCYTQKKGAGGNGNREK